MLHLLSNRNWRDAYENVVLHAARCLYIVVAFMGHRLIKTNGELRFELLCINGYTRTQHSEVIEERNFSMLQRFQFSQVTCYERLERG